MSEDRGLPETGLNDGGTAELGSLEITHKRQLGMFHKGYVKLLTSFNLSSIWTVVSQSTQASVMLTPYLSPEGPKR